MARTQNHADYTRDRKYREAEDRQSQQDYDGSNLRMLAFVAAAAAGGGALLTMGANEAVGPMLPEISTFMLAVGVAVPVLTRFLCRDKETRSLPDDLIAAARDLGELEPMLAATGPGGVYLLEEPSADGTVKRSYLTEREAANKKKEFKRAGREWIEGTVSKDAVSFRKMKGAKLHASVGPAQIVFKDQGVAENGNRKWEKMTAHYQDGRKLPAVRLTLDQVADRADEKEKGRGTPPALVIVDPRRVAA